MHPARRFLAELRRRHVVRAAVGHVVFFWLLIQVADVVLPYIGIVDEPVRWALVAGVALFPITVVVAWFFEHPWHRHSHGRLVIDAIVIVLIIGTAGAWVARNLPEVVHTRTSIAVLPFDSSGETFDASLSRAIAREVNSLLMKSKSIDVIGIETATSPVLAGLDPPAVADRLAVQHVLAGDISTSGNTMRVDLRLLDAAGKALWTGIIEDSVDNLFGVQERIAALIQDRLGAGADSVPVGTVARNRCWMPTDPAALEDYYTARYYIELRTDADVALARMREAIGLYERLIDTYPRFAEAYSGLAWAWAHLPAYDPSADYPDRVKHMQALARRAIELCPTLTEALHILPNRYDHENSWIGTHRQLTAFVELEPHRLENYQRLSRHYWESGLTEKAIQIAEKNYALDPLSPRAIRQLASMRQYTGRFDEAIELYELAAELGRRGPNFARMAKRAAACGDDIDCRIDAWPMLAPFRDSFRVIMRRPATEAEKQESLAVARALLAANPDTVTNFLGGAACEHPHLTDLYFDAWDSVFETGAYWFWPNTWKPACTAVWSDPRFPAVVEKAELVAYWHEVGWPAMCRPEGDGVRCSDPARLED